MGGAIFNQEYIGTISNTKFTLNTANDFGGAIYNASEETYGENSIAAGQINSIENTAFTSNSANIGGAIYNAGTIGIDGGTFENNSATNKGGAIYNAGVLNLTDTSFENNSATNKGGAIYTTTDLSITAKTTNVIFADNKANSVSNDIFVEGQKTINLNANENQSITFNGGISSDSLITLDINNQSISATNNGSILYKNAISNAQSIINNGEFKLLGNHTSDLDIIMTSPNATFEIGEGATLNLTNYNTTEELGTGNLINNGTLNITANTAVNDSVNITQTSNAITNVTEGKLVVNAGDNLNAGKINISGGLLDIQTDGNITTNSFNQTEGTTVISGGSLNLTDNSSIQSGNLNIIDGDITISGTSYISSDVTTNMSGGNINIDGGRATFNGADSLAGNINLNSGSLKLDEINDENLNLNILDGTLDISNGITSEINIATWGDNAILSFDADLSNSSDNYLLTDTITGLADGTKVTLGSINFISDMLSDYGQIKLSDTNIVTEQKITSSGAFSYLFKASNNGIIDVIKGFANGLLQAVKADGTRTYDFPYQVNENIIENIGTMNGTSLTIDGTNGNYGINGNKFNGIIVSNNQELNSNNQELNIKNVGTTDLTNSINGFVSDNGGFLKADGGTINIESSSFRANTATEKGGVLYNNSTITNIKNSIFNNNKAADGGAIYNSSTLEITNSIFNNNSATTNGGAIYNSSTLEITNSIFNNNSATTNGGAINNIGTIKLTDTSFTNNAALSKGGAIYNSGETTISAENKNIEFSGNTQNNNSNAIYNEGIVNLDIAKDMSITFNDAISGENGTINIAGAEGSVILNNSVTDNTINLNSGELVISTNGVIGEEVTLNTFEGSTTAIKGGKLTINLTGTNTDTANGNTILSSGNLYLQGYDSVSEITNLVATGGTINYDGANFILGDNSSVAKEVEIVFNNDTKININGGDLVINDNDTWDGHPLEVDKNGNLTLATGTDTTVSQGKELTIKEGNVTLAEDTKLTYGNNTDENGDKYTVQSGSFTLGDEVSGGSLTFANGEDNKTTISMTNQNSTLNIKDNSSLTLVQNSNNAGNINNGNINVAENSSLNLNSGAVNKNAQIELAQNSQLNISGGDIVIDNADNWNENATINLSAGRLNLHSINKTLSNDNINISGGTLGIENGSNIILSDTSIINNNSSLSISNSALSVEKGALNIANLNTSGTINTANKAMENHNISGDLIIGNEDSSVANFYIDIDPQNSNASDSFSAKNIISGTNGKATINIADFVLSSDPTDKKASYQIFNGNIDENIEFTTTDKEISTLIANYKLSSGNNSGNFSFERTSFNPSVMSTPVAAQVGGYLNQLNLYDYSFTTMDNMMMNSPQMRVELKHQNKYAFGDADTALYADDAEKNSIRPRYQGENDNSVWYKGYATFEEVDLENNTEVDNKMYGALIGVNSRLYDLPKGWSGMLTTLGGYTGSTQKYNGIKNYQNGGSIAVSASAYKGNFFTGLTAASGLSLVESNTSYGNDEFTMMMAGLASKSGYNWDLLNGKLIIQPTYLMSYTMVKSFDYTNAANIEINSNPLHSIQIQQGINLIGNLKYGWQPYAGFNMVWNLLNKSDYKANDVSLPQLSIDPYAQFNLGFNKTMGDRCTGFFQTTLRSGGRKGISLQGGITFKF